LFWCEVAVGRRNVGYKVIINRFPQRNPLELNPGPEAGVHLGIGLRRNAKTNELLALIHLALPIGVE
jgi:hypothetical protein